MKDSSDITAWSLVCNAWRADKRRRRQRKQLRKLSKQLRRLSLALDQLVLSSQEAWIGTLSLAASLEGTGASTLEMAIMGGYSSLNLHGKQREAWLTRHAPTSLPENSRLPWPLIFRSVTGPTVASSDDEGREDG